MHCFPWVLMSSHSFKGESAVCVFLLFCSGAHFGAACLSATNSFYSSLHPVPPQIGCHLEISWEMLNRNVYWSLSWNEYRWKAEQEHHMAKILYRYVRQLMYRNKIPSEHKHLWTLSNPHHSLPHIYITYCEYFVWLQIITCTQIMYWLAINISDEDLSFLIY